MRYRRLINGEPQFGQGRQDFLQGIYAVGQAIETRLKLYTGEWWEDLNDGLPLWTQIMGKTGSNTERFNAIITNRILGTKLNNTKLISSMISVTSVWDSSLRKYTYNGKAKSIYGFITITNGG